MKKKSTSLEERRDGKEGRREGIYIIARQVPPATATATDVPCLGQIGIPRLSRTSLPYRTSP
jgi:hypothetical protein